MTILGLPEPSPEARAHSERLVAFLQAAVRNEHGAIPFARFMELALYAPGLGYYSAGARKFGEGGDFVTAPELGPAFAGCVAEAVAPLMRGLHRPGFLELGGGSGAFARDALLAFDALGALPERYAILEPSADLRDRQQRLLAATLPPAVHARCDWLDGPPEGEWNGVLFANEVLDALPTTRFVVHEGEVYEEFVALDADGGFLRVDQPADALVRAAVRHVERTLGAPLPDGYRSEILPQLPYWVQAVGGLLRQGAMLFVDYGYPRREYYLPERRDGTLACHYRHRAHGDPFFLPGLQDITASVDFTALVEAGVHAGFDFAGYCTQSSFLIANGLPARIAEAEAVADDRERLRRMSEIRKLTLPGEMGERFQVMGFTRDVDLSAAFAFGDLSRRL
ncbi:MAG: SAM-dependent methyltransferase [Silanimonas sp.]|jgi:SAM-dependent MidA family methyltransferase|nr:SAM-dependent methyltransferase [Silanimonas sp.]